MTGLLLVTDADTRRLFGLADRLKAAGRSHFDHLAALRRRLRQARIVSPQAIPGDVVTLNSRVRLHDLDTGQKLTVTLSDPHDTTLFGERLSIASPYGSALLGKRVGQIVHWALGARLRRLRIEKMIYQPEAAGKFHL